MRTMSKFAQSIGQGGEFGQCLNLHNQLDKVASLDNFYQLDNVYIVNELVLRVRIFEYTSLKVVNNVKLRLFKSVGFCYFCVT